MGRALSYSRGRRSRPVVRRLKQCAWAGLALVAVLVVGGVVAVLIVGTRAHGGTLPPLLGNSAHNIRHMATHTDPDSFTFLVVGDVQHGTRTFERLLDIARADKPAFAVILGDFVSEPEFARHKLFATEIGEEAPPFPIFLVPGNHDISPTREFQLDDFERTYGPAQFTFALGKHLFVFLNTAPGYTQSLEYCRFLEEAVSRAGQRVQDVFVFMHVPPSGLSHDVIARELPGSERFLALAGTLRVRYVFAGDHHGYWKGKRGPTTYIVTGGGGAHLRGDHGRFHHAVRLAMHRGEVTETVLAVPHCSEWAEQLERNIVVHVWPVIIGSRATLAAIVALLFATVWLLDYSARRAWRRA